MKFYQKNGTCFSKLNGNVEAMNLPGSYIILQSVSKISKYAINVPYNPKNKKAVHQNGNRLPNLSGVRV